ncbi:MAG: glycosyltransferase family 4 protein [Nitrospinae bacterium]|nr:glycosyltransferase family 4 protein [Nitrospinota bacterium]MBL7021460.1 glycosyltransferase family 4 protein [Nitrospinaceae bacterium]
MNGPEKNLTILSLQYHCYPDDVGGAWGLTYEVNKRLVARGQRVHLITCKPAELLPNEEEIDGVSFHRISVRDSKNVISLWRAVRRRVNHILKSEKIDLIHIHNPLVGFVAILHPQLWKVPKICHFHSSWYDEEKINQVGTETSEIPWRLQIQLQLIRLMEWAGYAVSRTILFLSEYSKNRFLRYYPFTQPKLCVISGGVDIEAFKPPNSTEEISVIREKLKLSAEIPLLLTVRRLEQRMGLENLICAAGILHRQSPDLKFQMVLTGKGSLKDRLEQLILEQGVSHCVQLVGLVPRETLPLYFRCADLFVLPTIAIEGFGLVTAEALASGLPVMGTPVGATEEILKQVDERLLFHNTSPDALAEGIETFLRSPETFQEMGSKCRELAVAQYSWETMVKKIEQEFIKAMA